MNRPPFARFLFARSSVLASAALCVACALVAGTGCKDKPTPAARPTLAPKYTPLPPREVPDWLRGSILEQVDLGSTEPFRVSNYGLVVLKRPTAGDVESVPNTVREYIIREMTRRGFGSQNLPGFENLSPEQVLRDRRVAVVRVDGFVAPGAAKGQRFDVQVSALEDSNTQSLAGGSLYVTDLAPNGANPSNPGNTVDVLAEARGYVFVNPAYTLDADPNDPVQRRALTTGLILNGGRMKVDRPIGLLIRAAEGRLAKMTEARIQQLTADPGIASAKDERSVFVKVPDLYRGDWEHFIGVVTHTFYSTDSAFQVRKSRELAAEAVKPNAALLDISYCWEAIGSAAMPDVQSLYTHPNPEVAFAAARAGAFIGDAAAEATLVSMARDASNPFGTVAVQTLSALPPTPAVNTALRSLLSTTDARVRIEAYRGLVRNKDTVIFSKAVGGDKFNLDIVAVEGPPLIYATRVGIPRIAFIGSPARLPQGVFFSAMNNEFSISPIEGQRELLTLFYRGAGVREPVKQLSTPDLAEVVARLGGEGPMGQPKLDFSYGEIVAIIAQMSDRGMIAATDESAGKPSFVLQDLPNVNRDVDTAPIIPEGPRPVISGAAPQARSE